MPRSKSPRDQPPVGQALNAAIGNCGRARRWAAALQLLSNALAVKLTPTVIHFTSVVTVCGRSENWRCALQLLADMPLATAEPNLITFNAAVNACAKAWLRDILFFELAAAAIEENPHGSEVIKQS